MLVQRLIKTTFAAAALALAAWVMVFGPRAEPPPVKDRVTIHYWEKWTGLEAEQMMQIVNQFNETVGREKGIYVQYLSMSNVNQKTLIATAAGVPPDIAGLWDAQVCQFAASDALEPLDELAAARGITAAYYKPVYWQACRYQGKLYALISTPAAVALHYNKQVLLDHAQSLRAAGLEPKRPPRTLQELDQYAQALDVITTSGGKKQLISAGYLPMEPGWYVGQTGLWFGINPYDAATGKLLLNHPRMVEALMWIQSYSQRLGQDTMGEFRSGLGQFNSTQNPFLTGTVAMVLQGPWMANYIENLKPEMNRWKFPKENEAKLPHEQRKENYQWGVAPFPSALGGLEDVTFCPSDTLVIPKGSRHKQEAFEFMAFVNRQDVMEKLNSMHCKNSPLAKVSREFVENHPNPYIDVFEKLASSPHAYPLPEVGVWPQIGDELNTAIQRVYLMRATPQEALDAAQVRAQGFLDHFNRMQALRREQAQ